MHRLSRSGRDGEVGLGASGLRAVRGPYVGLAVRSPAMERRMRPSSLADPLTPEEVAEANKNRSDLWIHVRCKLCGEVECCFNRSAAARKRMCFSCLMGWTKESRALARPK